MKHLSLKLQTHLANSTTEQSCLSTGETLGATAAVPCSNYCGRTVVFTIKEAFYFV